MGNLGTDFEIDDVGDATLELVKGIAVTEVAHAIPPLGVDRGGDVKGVGLNLDEAALDRAPAGVAIKELQEGTKGEVAAVLFKEDDRLAMVVVKPLAVAGLPFVEVGAIVAEHVVTCLGFGGTGRAKVYRDGGHVVEEALWCDNLEQCIEAAVELDVGLGMFLSNNDNVDTLFDLIGADLNVGALALLVDLTIVVANPRGIGIDHIWIGVARVAREPVVATQTGLFRAIVFTLLAVASSLLGGTLGDEEVAIEELLADSRLGHGILELQVDLEMRGAIGTDLFAIDEVGALGIEEGFNASEVFGGIVVLGGTVGTVSLWLGGHGSLVWGNIFSPEGRNKSNTACTAGFPRGDSPGGMSSPTRGELPGLRPGGISNKDCGATRSSCQWGL